MRSDVARTPSIRIRPLAAGETAPIDAVFDGMSAHSRYLRFHGPRPRLTDTMRRQLAAVDDERHLALVAEVCEGDDVATVGVARLIAVGDDTAEVAFAVVDAWHGRGVARRLVTALRFRAIDLGYRMVTAHVMAENRAAAGLLLAVFPDAAMRRDGMAYLVVAALPQRAGAVPVALAV